MRWLVEDKGVIVNSRDGGGGGGGGVGVVCGSVLG